MHSAYDLGLVGIVTVIIVFVISLFTGESLENMDETALTREGAMHTSAIWTHYVYNIIPIIIIVWQFMKSAHKEQKIIQKNLKDESVDIVQENEKCAIEMEPLFSKRKYRYDTLPKKIRKKIAWYQNLLAYLKEYSKIIEDKKEFEDVARAIKKEIIQLRTVK
jgi:hypothetical protein